MSLENVLKYEETAVFKLRALYKKYGYSQFKMSKFEEYDLYVRNKDFLISDRIITFNDTNGKLLALKPDVTLSIIKNSSDKSGSTEKVYYNENVYRVSGSTHAFKEIMQSGLECIGDIDLYSECEVISLALRSLATVSENYLLDLSHTGIVTALLDKCALPQDARRRVMICLGEKNTHGIREICRAEGVNCEVCDRLCALSGIYGAPDKVLPELENLLCGEGKNAYAELCSICDVLRDEGLCENVRIDFSVANDMNYYSGVVFRGFVDGVPSGILSGGRYDLLMHKMGKKSGAIGFAVYLDLIERLDSSKKSFDIDTLLLYSENSGASEVLKAVEKLSDCGKVFASRAIPEKMTYRRLVKLTDRGLETVEENG